MKKVIYLFSLCFLISPTLLNGQDIEILDDSNPVLRINNGTSALDLGIATCDGCFSDISKIGDAILRADGMATGNLILAARSLDGIVFTTGDGNTDVKRAEILNDGKFVIGNIATSGDYGLYVEKGILADKLSVGGHICTNSLRITASSCWADYVFSKDYQLMPLEKVESFIQENQHLPNVPSANEIENNGIDVEMVTVSQQEKIEELFLHLIEMNKRMKEIEAENKKLKAEIRKLHN